MNIDSLDLKRQYKSIKKEVGSAVRDLFESQSFILGKTVSDFEEKIADYCGVKYAVGCASGTDAILLSLMVAGIEVGDEVVVPSFTFIASAEPIARLGAKPVFADILPDTYNLDPESFEKAVTKKTRAVVVVHLYGQTADMKDILTIAKKYRLKVIEDVAQAIGAFDGSVGKRAGSMGDFGAFSFFPSKNLGGCGDGGMITVNNRKRLERLSALRQHGSNRRYYHDILGMNSRLDALQAAVLNVKLKYLDKWLKEREEKAGFYNKLFAEKFGGSISVPVVREGNKHTYHQYVIRIAGVSGKRRDSLINYLRENGVGANIYYPLPCHRQKCFSYLKKVKLPVTDKVSKEVIALPIYPELKPVEQKYIVELIGKWLKRV